MVSTISKSITVTPLYLPYSFTVSSSIWVSEKLFKNRLRCSLHPPTKPKVCCFRQISAMRREYFLHQVQIAGDFDVLIYTAFRFYFHTLRHNDTINIACIFIYKSVVFASCVNVGYQHLVIITGGNISRQMMACVLFIEVYVCNLSLVSTKFYAVYNIHIILPPSFPRRFHLFLFTLTPRSWSCMFVISFFSLNHF